MEGQSCLRQSRSRSRGPLRQEFRKISGSREYSGSGAQVQELESEQENANPMEVPSWSGSKQELEALSDGRLGIATNARRRVWTSVKNKMDALLAEHEREEAR